MASGDRCSYGYGNIQYGPLHHKQQSSLKKMFGIACQSRISIVALFTKVLYCVAINDNICL